MTTRELPPRLELECLKALWNLGQANVRDVQTALARPLAYTTVMTVLDRLARRGCVERRKVGRGFVYSAILTRDSVRRVALDDLIHSLFDGSEESLRHYLAQTEPRPVGSGGYLTQPTKAAPNTEPRPILASAQGSGAFSTNAAPTQESHTEPRSVGSGG
jgi:predicted transcriptional regulator